MNKIFLDELQKVTTNNHYMNRYIKLVDIAIQTQYEEGSYLEKHHILPVSLFPEYSDWPDNLVAIPPKLHYILHYLLYKSTNSPSMILAFNMMSRVKHGKKTTCRLYHDSRQAMSEMQRLRRHYYNTATNEHIFSIEKPIGDEWVRKSPNSSKGKSKGYKFWAHNPQTNEQTAFAKGSVIPPGWVKGRMKDSSFSGFDEVNKKIRVFDYKIKGYVMIDKNTPLTHWQETQIGVKIVAEAKIYVVGNKISLVAQRLVPMLKYRTLDTKITSHHNASPEMKQLAIEHEGKSIREVFNVQEILLKDFIYDEKFRTV